MYVYVLHTYMFNVYKKYYTYVKYQGDENMYNINTGDMWPHTAVYNYIFYFFLFLRPVLSKL